MQNEHTVGKQMVRYIYKVNLVPLMHSNQNVELYHKHFNCIHVLCTAMMTMKQTFSLKNSKCQTFMFILVLTTIYDNQLLL